MQLKLRVGINGSPLTIDVEPTDTFQDLSDRLYNIGGVKVDLSQLKSNNKPFDMSTNVINYFLPKHDGETTGESAVDGSEKPKRFCRLCSEIITSDPIFLFEEEPDDDFTKITLIEKVNSTLPIFVSARDHFPKQICESCNNLVNYSFDFMKKVIAGQLNLEQLYHIKAADRQLTSFKEEEACPLCSMGHFKHIDSNCQIMDNGLEKQKDGQRKEVVISVPRNGGTKREYGRTIIKEEPIDSDYMEENRDIVTGYWDATQDNSDVYVGMKKYRKRIKMDDDADWTIDEEYVPVSRRGRPRGTKNKPKVPIPIVEKTCILCGWMGVETDMYAHAINQHCQPDMDYFPCPLCKTNQPNEMILETHIEKHNSRKKDK